MPRYKINISSIYKKLGPNICLALPGSRALTGCDYNDVFYQKGKKKALDLMINNPIFTEAFIDFDQFGNLEI